MNYICYNCGTAFDEETAREHLEFHREVKPWFVEKYLLCPVCGCDRYEDAVKCKKCKRPFRFSDLRGGYYCDDCIEEITNAVTEHEFIKAEIDAYAEFLHERRSRGGLDNDES